jgi:hypothetical protein
LIAITSQKLDLQHFLTRSGGGNGHLKTIRKKKVEEKQKPELYNQLKSINLSIYPSIHLFIYLSVALQSFRWTFAAISVS